MNSIEQKLAQGKKLRILFINDVGFQYGAGIALLRQIQSFLLLGHEVAGLCWVQGQVEASIPLKAQNAPGKWLGMAVLTYLHADYGVSDRCIIDNLVLEAEMRQPDVIIVGNLHGAKWPLELLPALQTLGCPVIAYMHDCYLLTGRCAYTGSCTLHKIGCNDSCPTAEQYPPLAPEKIFDAWALRRQIFCGADGIPLAANSNWTLQMAQQALNGVARADCLYYGLDEQLFQPIDKTLARHLLGIPQDWFVVLGGCVDINDRRKGGHIFNELVPKLRDKMHFLVFGANSKQLDGVQGTGLVRDYRRMPLVFNAADLFVGTSLEEAFGQTFCEAAACAVPIVAFQLDGIPEVARHTINARLAPEISAEAMIEEIKFFYHHPEERVKYGQAGRAMVEAEFTLQKQGERWLRYLPSLAIN
jgi:glycosyltransferase involved in cell wall biosynthesis